MAYYSTAEIDALLYCERTGVLTKLNDLMDYLIAQGYNSFEDFFNEMEELRKQEKIPPRPKPKDDIERLRADFLGADNVNPLGSPYPDTVKLGAVKIKTKGIRLNGF